MSSKVTPYNDLADAGNAESKEVSVNVQGDAGQKAANAPSGQQPGKFGAKDKMEMYVNKACFFTISDLVEDKCRVRLLNVVAFSLVYIFAVFAMLGSLEKSLNVTHKVVFSNPPAAFSFAGRFHESSPAAAILPQRSQKIFATSDSGAPMQKVNVEVNVHDFRSNGPLPCSSDEVAARNGTLQSLRYKDVCSYDKVEFNTQETDKYGQATLSDFRILGPTGLYKLRAEANGVESKEETKMLMATPVMYMEVIDPDSDPSSEMKYSRPPTFVQVRKNITKPPALVLFDENLIPLQNRTVIAIATPDPTWPPTGPKAQPSPNVHMRGEKIVELNCAESLPSDVNGVAKFPDCFGVKGANVDHFFIVFSESGFVFRPWHDMTYSPAALYPVNVKAYRYPTLITTHVETVQLLTGKSASVFEGEKLDPAPEVSVKDASGNPLADVPCYATMAYDQSRRLPKYFRHQKKGVVNKEILHAKAVTGSDGVAKFQDLRFTVRGNIVDTDYFLWTKGDTAGDTGGYSAGKFKMAFICDGVEQTKRATDPTYGGEVVLKPVTTLIRIKRFVRKSAFLSKYGSIPSPDGSDTFLAVVRVMDANGKGVIGKNLQVKPAHSSSKFAVDVVPEMWEATNDMGFAVVPFRFHYGDGNFLQDGKQTFSVKFIVDGVTSDASESLTARLLGNRDDSMCQMLLPFFGVSIRLKYDINGAVNGFDPISSVAGGTLLEAESGNAIIMSVRFVGQSNSVCMYDANSTAKPQNATQCALVTMYSSFRNRRLSDNQSVREDDTSEEASVRALSVSAPSLVMKLEDTFSTETGEGQTIAFQPNPFLRTLVISDPNVRSVFSPLGLAARMPTVETASESAQATIVTSLAGPSGLHLFYAHAQIQNPLTGAKQDCYSPPVPVLLYNLLEDIEVSGDSGMDHYALLAEPEVPVNIILRLIPADTKQLPSWVQLTEQFWSENGIQFTFEEAPYNYHQALGVGVETEANINMLSTPQYELVPRVCSSCDAKGYDKGNGRMYLQFKFKQRGIFGRFGIKFHGFGIFTRVFTWTQKPPKGIKVEVIQEPQAKPQPLSGDFMKVYPALKVTDGEGKPVEGTILSYETIAEPGMGYFSKLLDLPMYSPLPFLYSDPSDASGVAKHELFSVLDGFGCARFLWLAADGVETEPVPKANPICFEPAWDYTIVPGNEPPASMPIGMAVKDIQGASFQVEARSRLGRVSDVSRLFGLLVSRIVVVNNAGAELNDNEIFGKSLNQLSEAVCVWFNPDFTAWGKPEVFSGSKEVMYLKSGAGNGRCTDLEVVQSVGTEVRFGQVVQSAGTAIVRFKWKNWKWSRLVQEPGKMKVSVGDLSTSQIYWRKVLDTPQNFSLFTQFEKYTTCVEDAKLSQEEMATKISSEIKAEVEPSSYSVELPPPPTVDVGSMFLVRIKLLTASGGPVPGAVMRVGIKQLASTNPNTATPDFLQLMAQGGNNLDVVKNGEVELDATNLVRESKKDGTVTFPITVARGTTGTYALEFQPEKAQAKIVLQTAPFKLVNQIVGIEGVDSTWTDMEVDKFGVETKIVHKPSFRVVTSGGETLENLTDEGTALRIRLILKAVSTKVQKSSALVEAAKKSAIKQAQQDSANYLNSLANSASASLKDSIQLVENKTKSKAIGMFSGFTEQFAELCLSTPARHLQSGDAAEAKSLASSISPPMAASTSEAVTQTPDAIDPAEQLGMFTDVIMSGGNSLKPKQDMKVRGEWQLTLDNFKRRDDGAYQLQDDLKLVFQPEMEYKFVLAINGVVGKDDTFPAFKVIKKKEDPIDVAFSWFCSSVAAVLTVILLTTNTILHQWWWFLISIFCTVGLMIWIPFMNKYRDAMNGSFLIIAYVNLVLILIGLIFGLLTEFLPDKFKTFATKRKEVFEKYSRRKTMQLISVKDPGLLLKPKLIATIKKTFFKPFDEEEAFYFPSNLLIAMFLAFMSWAYIFVRSLDMLESLKDTLETMINKAVEAAINLTAQINNMWYANTQTDLPDAATDFMYKQIDLLRTWFHQLVDSLHIGCAVGITLATIITLFSIISMFIAFRNTVLEARKGRFGFELKNAKVVYAATFIGVNISSTIIGFLLITFLVTLILIPLTWSVVWKMLWNMLPTILSVFVLPKVITILSKLILKKCLFEDFLFKTRAGGSIFFFWQTVLAIAGGVIGAIVRFVLGLVGVLCLLPTTFGANTPELFNQIYLLDSSYRTYLGAVYCHCTHNHPIMITAADRLLSIVETKKAVIAKGQHWTSTRRLLILILIRFPHLRQYRKSVLQEKKDLLALEKQLKGKDKDDASKDQGKPKLKVHEPWIENAIEGVCADLADTSRRLELCRKYQLVIGAKPNSPEAEEAKQKLRRLLSTDGVAGK